MSADEVARALDAIAAVDAAGGALVDDAEVVALAREVAPPAPTRRRASPRPPRTPDSGGWFRRPVAS